MFQVGDKIFYPMHGAGVIEVIEEREILKQKHLYYVINMYLRDMQVMIPIKQTESLGIRPVVEDDILENVFEKIHDEHDDIELPAVNTHQRQQLYMKKIKSGDIYDNAQVIRELTFLSKEKHLGTGDKMLLDNAKQIFISEVMLVKDIEEEQAFELLEQIPSAQA